MSNPFLWVAIILDSEQVSCFLITPCLVTQAALMVPTPSLLLGIDDIVFPSICVYLYVRVQFCSSDLACSPSQKKVAYNTKRVVDCL